MKRFWQNNWKSLLPVTILLLVMYIGVYQIATFWIADPMISKGVYVSNILVYTPLVIFLTSLVYASFKGFSYALLALVFLLYPLTILAFDEWIVEYQLFYTACSLLGNGFGALLFSLRKKMKKNP
ncbi:TPA: hypothetical protein ACGO3A_001357 [Streptococcus suis]